MVWCFDLAVSFSKAKINNMNCLCLLCCPTDILLFSLPHSLINYLFSIFPPLILSFMFQTSCGQPYPLWSLHPFVSLFILYPLVSSVCSHPSPSCISTSLLLLTPFMFVMCCVVIIAVQKNSARVQTSGPSFLAPLDAEFCTYLS